MNDFVRTLPGYPGILVLQRGFSFYSTVPQQIYNILALSYSRFYVYLLPDRELPLKPLFCLSRPVLQKGYAHAIIFCSCNLFRKCARFRRALRELLCRSAICFDDVWQCSAGAQHLSPTLQYVWQEKRKIGIGVQKNSKRFLVRSSVFALFDIFR